MHCIGNTVFFFLPTLEGEHQRKVHGQEGDARCQYDKQTGQGRNSSNKNVISTAEVVAVSSETSQIILCIITENMQNGNLLSLVLAYSIVLTLWQVRELASISYKLHPGPCKTVS